MMTLTEQFKQGKLEEYKRYYCKTVWFEDIFMARCHNKGQNDEWWTLENEKYSYNNIHHIKDIEVLAEVPSYEEYLSLTYAKEEDEKIIAEYEEENTKLKELLKRIGKELNDCPTCVEGSWKAELVDKIDQVLGEE